MRVFNHYSNGWLFHLRVNDWFAGFNEYCFSLSVSRFLGGQICGEVNGERGLGNENRRWRNECVQRFGRGTIRWKVGSRVNSDGQRQTNGSLGPEIVKQK